MQQALAPWLGLKIITAIPTTSQIFHLSLKSFCWFISARYLPPGGKTKGNRQPTHLFCAPLMNIDPLLLVEICLKNTFCSVNFTLQRAGSLFCLQCSLPFYHKGSFFCVYTAELETKTSNLLSCFVSILLHLRRQLWALKRVYVSVTELKTVNV